MTDWHDDRLQAPLPEAVASASLGGAVGFAALAVTASPPAAAGAALVGATLTFAALQRLAVPAPLPIASFAPAELPECEELLLTEEMMFAEELDELLLEDRLDEPETDSRVIQLFDPAIPTAGELQERIERHLRLVDGRPAVPVSDDADALREALSALRQSIR